MNDKSSISVDAPAPRLCHIHKLPDFDGYGFNLHAERGKPGQFIGKVDEGSPAAAAGLQEGDRIVEVNGSNVALESHQKVVERIKAMSDEVKLLVVDAVAEAFYREHNIVVTATMPNVVALETPHPVYAASDIEAPTHNGATACHTVVAEVIIPPEEPRHNGTTACYTVVAGVLLPPATDGDHRARLCVLGTWPDFTGYGFNLHAERGKPAQYIGKVDAQSPAQAAGLREGDRIAAVNGVDVADSTHQDVVRRIRSDPSKVELLVIDRAADLYFRDHGVVVSSSMEESAVQKIICPPANVYTSLSSPPVPPYNDSSADQFDHRPRLCHIRSWNDGRGFGFNMQAERGKQGQFIGKVESGSPAEAAGLQDADRVVEVNGSNIDQDTHKQVVEKIKAVPNEARLLVVDQAADRYFADKGIAISSELSCVQYISCPATKPFTADDGSLNSAENTQVTATDYETVTNEMTELAVTMEQNDCQNIDVKTAMSDQDQPLLSTAFNGPPKQTPLVFSGSAEEARQRMTKKRDIRTSGMSLKDKYDLLQKL